MPARSTLIQNAISLDNIYPASKQDAKKTKVQTHGTLYHARMNMGHE